MLPSYKNRSIDLLRSSISASFIYITERKVKETVDNDWIKQRKCEMTMLGPKTRKQKYKIWFVTGYGASDSENLIIFYVRQWFFCHTCA